MHRDALVSWQRARPHSAWDPRDIDLSQDAVDWLGLSAPEHDALLRLTALFHAGERGLALDLLPLVQVIVQEGRLEEELYLSSFLWEEAKHVETCRRFFADVVREPVDIERYRTASWHLVYKEELPRALRRLRVDASPVAQAEASVTYGLIVEGVLAETGYHACHAMLARNGIMPGMQRAVSLLKDDQTRHLSYGVFLLSRLAAEHGEPVWRAIQSRVEGLSSPALSVISDTFASCAKLPFGLDPDEMQTFARNQLQRRMACIESARSRPVSDICGCEDSEGI